MVHQNWNLVQGRWFPFDVFIHRFHAIPWNTKNLHGLSKGKTVSKFYKNSVSIWIVRNFNETLFTFLNVSREHGKFPKPCTIAGCWALNMITTSLRLSSTGNEYQSHWQSTSKIANDLLVIHSPTSQVANIANNDPKTKLNTIVNSIGFKLRSDWNQMLFFSLNFEKYRSDFAKVLLN